jgi:hypothetical protein
MRLLLKVLLALLLVYLLVAGGISSLMYQPPAKFSKVISHVPELFFAILPFESLWLFARSGHLKVGSAAPDFRLPTLDKTSQVQLSSFRGEKPVVLVFGSYT